MSFVMSSAAFSLAPSPGFFRPRSGLCSWASLGLWFHQIIPITALEYAALAWLTGSAAALRAQGRSQSLLRLRTIFSTFTLIFAGLGASLVGDVWGVAAGLALAAISGAVLGGRLLLGPPRV